MPSIPGGFPSFSLSNVMDSNRAWLFYDPDTFFDDPTSISMEWDLDADNSVLLPKIPFLIQYQFTLCERSDGNTILSFRSRQTVRPNRTRRSIREKLVDVLAIDYLYGGLEQEFLPISSSVLDHRYHTIRNPGNDCVRYDITNFSNDLIGPIDAIAFAQDLAGIGFDSFALSVAVLAS